MPNHKQNFGRNFVNRRPAASNSNSGVPGLILCCVCRVRKSKDNFANRQLGKFTLHNKSFQRDPGSIKVTCKTCTPSQTSELRCCVCDTAKDLTHFAKSQRRDPDRARCLDCVGRDLETEPDLPPPDSSDESLSEDDDWEESSFPKSAGPSETAEAPDPLTNSTVPPVASPLVPENKPSGPPNQESEWELATGGSSKSRRQAQGSGVGRGSSLNSYSTSPPAPSVAGAGTNRGGWAKGSKPPTAKSNKWGKVTGPSEMEDDPYAHMYGKAPNAKKEKRETYYHSDDD